MTSSGSVMGAGDAVRKVGGGGATDTTGPVITLTGDPTMSVEVGGAYTEAGET